MVCSWLFGWLMVPVIRMVDRLVSITIRLAIHVIAALLIGHGQSSGPDSSTEFSWTGFHVCAGKQAKYILTTVF